MLIVTSKYVRPSTSVEFYKDDVFNAYRIATYVNTGKLTQVSDTLSSDGLTRTVVNEWTLRDNLTEFKQDAQASQYFAARQLYNETNGITKTNDFEYVPTDGDQPVPI